ncbi:MAG: Transcriptional regulatory protein BtsR [Rhodocyclaceae bacterium]|nr:MAG: response regulator transcription factor [Rhodocyclaceae bacterium]MBV6408807.1 Transcriptional regulatory protein BtsR [Rhodocyclaceae bacterium]CAG0945789.1 Transcriptional regulatory protein BtsR [Gammaproteobacteria bacterium]
MSETLRVFIVDDEAPARARMKALLADIAAELPNETVGEAANGVEALARLAEARADVALVDIRMPQMDGIELARHLAGAEHPPAVVFTTAYDQYAVQAFELNAVDYLVKPVRAQRLAAALERARRAPHPGRETLARLAPEPRRHLSVSERGRILLVPVYEILYLKAELKYVTARTVAREYLLDESLTHLEQEFAVRFVRVHRNCLVARQAIAGFERSAAEDGEAHWTVLLAGLAEKLPVSRRQWSAVKAAFAGETKA